MFGWRRLRAQGRVVLVTALVTTPLVTLGGVAAHAAARTQHRTRCTIVGTRGADRLVGTPGHDVICGRGGNDILLGRGGDDVLLGGPGADRLDGGPGNDVLRGQGGADTIVGDSGADLASGGAGGDVERGGTGRDRVLGGLGNDDLDGGPAADTIDGGDGTNWCIVDSADISTRCVYDTTAPTADVVEWSTDRVDVTSSDQDVTVRVHVTDDTGARTVSLVADGGGYELLGTQLASGSVRDGWWIATLTVPQYAAPGSYRPIVYVEDRVGHRSTVDLQSFALTIDDSNPDTEMPQASLISPAPTTTYDVTAAGAVVTIKARIVDPVSGVDADMTEFILREPRSGNLGYADHATTPDLVDGTIHDGVWKGSITIDKGSLGGDWSIGVLTSDLAHRGSRWTTSYWGPAEYSTGYSGGQPLPDGMGNVRVIGSDHTDDDPPVVVDAQASPATIDTLPGPAQVSVSAHVTDVGTAVQYVGAWLYSSNTSDDTVATTGLSLASGSAADGVWTGALQVPQGTPPGTYYLAIFSMDGGNNDSWCMSSAFPGVWPWSCQLSGATTVTVADTSG